MTLKLFELVGTDVGRPFSPFCWRTRMALAHKGLSAETIPWCFTEKDAIAPHKSEKVPVLLDGENSVANSWAIANYLEDRYPDRPSLFGGTGRPRHGPDDQLVGRHRRGRRHVSADCCGYPAAPETGRCRLFPQEPRSALRQAAGRSHGRPRQGRRGFSARARSDAAHLEDATLSRRRCAELCRLHRVRSRSSGRAWSARSSCSPRKIRSMRGGKNCSMRSTAWRANRQAIRCSRGQAFGKPTVCDSSTCWSWSSPSAPAMASRSIQARITVESPLEAANR